MRKRELDGLTCNDEGLSSYVIDEALETEEDDLGLWRGREKERCLDECHKHGKSYEVHESRKGLPELTRPHFCVRSCLSREAAGSLQGVWSGHSNEGTAR